MKKLKIIAFIFLGIHLFATHVKLIWHLNPDGIFTIVKFQFKYILVSEDAATSAIFAIAYSLMTAIALYLNARKLIILTYASLDALAVFLYYNSDFGEYGILFNSIYYAIYTFIIIISLSMIKFSNEIELKELISKLNKVGMQGKDIANRLNISESKVSRTLKPKQ